MKYEVDLPSDVDQQLAAKASQTGQEVAHLIRTAVIQFVAREAGPAANGQWSEGAETRRRELIDKDIAGTITEAERVELARLDRLANEHFDRVAPPPMDGARRLHQQLLRSHAPGE